MDKELKTFFQIDDDIELRTLVEGDAEMVFEVAWANREHLQTFMHWMTPDYSLASAKEFIERSVAAVKEKQSVGYGIFRGEKLIGSIGYGHFDWKARKTEIGYWIAKDEEGKGIVTSACRVLIGYAFGELGLKRISIQCSAENTRSAAIPKRLGFTLEGTLRQSEWRNGKLHDFIIHGLLADDSRLW